MLIHTLSPNDARWTEVLRELRHDLHHRPMYVELEGERMKATPEAILIREGEQVFFIPYLIRSCNSLFPQVKEPILDVVSPYGYPGFLLNEHGKNATFAAQALTAFRDTMARRGVCAIFLRMNPILGEDHSTLFPPDTFHDSSPTVVVDLTLPEEQIMKQVRRAFQQTYRKGKAFGFTTRMTRLDEVLDEFVELYNQTMDRVQAKECYYFDRDYLAKLARLPCVHCCVIDHGATTAAACIVLECDGVVNTHLGGTRSEFLAQSPFTSVIFEVMQWAKSRSNRWLQLGGGVGGREDSVLHFKAGFSDKRIPFMTSRFILDEARYSQLVDCAARAKNTTPDGVRASSFFPAYRS